MLRSSSPGQVVGSLVANQVFAIRLVQWLGWVFKTQKRKKESLMLTLEDSDAQWKERRVWDMAQCPESRPGG